jgi:hypothetical protein
MLEISQTWQKTSEFDGRGRLPALTFRPLHSILAARHNSRIKLRLKLAMAENSGWKIFESSPPE